MRFLNDLFLALLTAIALAALVFAHAAGAQVPEPQGYSMGPPHGEVPDTPTGARVLGFPGIGKGKLEASLEAYYQEQLRALTGEDPDRQIVFYCHPQCRASWNAAKRVLPFGSASCGWGPQSRTLSCGPVSKLAPPRSVTAWTGRWRCSAHCCEKAREPVSSPYRDQLSEYGNTAIPPRTVLVFRHASP